MQTKLNHSLFIFGLMILFFSAAFPLVQAQSVAPGDLDTTFGIGGKVGICNARKQDLRASSSATQTIKMFRLITTATGKRTLRFSVTEPGICCKARRDLPVSRSAWQPINQFQTLSCHKTD